MHSQAHEGLADRGRGKGEEQGQDTATFIQAATYVVYLKLTSRLLSRFLVPGPAIKCYTPCWWFLFVLVY